MKERNISKKETLYNIALEHEIARSQNSHLIGTRETNTLDESAIYPKTIRHKKVKKRVILLRNKQKKVWTLHTKAHFEKDHISTGQ